MLFREEHEYDNTFSNRNKILPTTRLYRKKSPQTLLESKRDQRKWNTKYIFLETSKYLMELTLDTCCLDVRLTD